MWFVTTRVKAQNVQDMLETWGEACPPELASSHIRITLPKNRHAWCNSSPIKSKLSDSNSFRFIWSRELSATVETVATHNSLRMARVLLFGFICCGCLDMCLFNCYKQGLLGCFFAQAFVTNELKGLKQDHRSISLHIGASEAILKHKTKGSLRRGDLQDILRVEHSMLHLWKFCVGISVDFQDRYRTKQIANFVELHVFTIRSCISLHQRSLIRFTFGFMLLLTVSFFANASSAILLTVNRLLKHFPAPF